MALVYATDLVVLAAGSDAESGTWGEFVGWASGGIPGNETENFIQATQSKSQTFGNATTGKSIAFDAGSDISGSIPAGDVVMGWVFMGAGTNLFTFASGGHRFGIGTSLTNFDMWSISGDDRQPNPYGGWWNVAIDPTVTPDYTGGTGSGGAWQFFGSLIGDTTLGIRVKIAKGNPHAVDGMLMGRGEIYCTGATADFTEMSAANDANDISFVGDLVDTDATVTNITDTIALYPGAPITGTGIPGGTTVLSITNSTTIEMSANATATNTGVAVACIPYNRWGLLQNTGGGTFLWKGLMSLGQSGTSATFSDSNKTIVIDDTAKVASTFNKIEIRHASSSITWTNITITAKGTVSPGQFEMIEDAATMAWTGCSFNNLGTFIFLSNAVITACNFIGCGIITTGNNDMATSIISGFEGTVDTSALIWNDAADPNGKLDDMIFTKGTADTHAIEFGLSSPTTITINDIVFNSYGADASTSAAIYFARTTGTVTVNYSGTVPTFKTAGATIDLVATVDVDVHVEDADQADIQFAQVFISKNPATAYTSGAGNTAADGDLVLTQTIDADVPQISWAIVYDVSENLTLPYRFTSHDGANTVTFPTSVTGAATSTGSATSLISTSTDFVAADIEEGDTIRNTTTGAYAVVDEIVDLDNITTSPLNTGVWSASDGFSVHDLATTLISGTDTVDIPLALGQTDVNGDLATLSYKSSEVPTPVVIRTRLIGATKYISGKTNGTIIASGLAVNVTLQLDTEA